MKLKQFLCPIRPTLYLVGGLEFGHNWRTVEGIDEIICNKCGKFVYCPAYKTNTSEARELLSLKNTK